MGLESVQNRYLDGRPVQNCADATAALIDSEVMALLKECYDKAKERLMENRDVLDKIAEYLFEKETITGKEFMKIYREVKGIPEPEEEPKKSGKAAEESDPSANSSKEQTGDASADSSKEQADDASEAEGTKEKEENTEE